MKKILLIIALLITTISFSQGYKKTSSGLLNTTISISSAQILSLNSSPIEIIPAPGVGKVINVVNSTLSLNYGTTPYTSTVVRIRYGGGNDVTNVASIISETSNSIWNGRLTIMEIFQNDKIEIITDANPTGGDSTMDIYITYEIITL